MRTQYFKIYPDPENEKYFYRVCVFPSQRAINRAYEKQCGPLKAGENLGGYCTRLTVLSYKKGKRAKLSGYLGDIALNIKDITAEIVSHECAHAALGYMRRIKRHKLIVGRQNNKQNKVNDAEEEFCYALGRMASQIAKWDNSWNRSRNK